MSRHAYAALMFISLGSIASSNALAAGADRYYAITVDGKAVGYDHFSVTRAASGTTVMGDTLIKISALGSPLDITTHSVSKYALDGVTPVSFDETVTRSGASTTYRTTFGKQSAHWSQTAGAGKTTKESALKLGTMLAAGTDSWEAILRKTPPSSNRFSVIVFDPTLGKSETLSLKRETSASSADEVWVTTIETVVGPQSIQLRYRRKTGTIVGMTFPAQKVSMRLADKTALKNFGSLDYTSHLVATVETPLSNPNALTVLSLKVSATIKLDKISVASLQHSPRQTFQGTAQNGKIDGVFTIRPLRYDGKQSPAYPYSSSTTAGQSQWLKPSSYTESDDPRIKALAKTLTASSKTAWQAAAAIGHWVHDNIRYEITGSGASQCLASRTGDCGPHSWLSIALCRAAGIPARIQGGALYTSLTGGSYAQHYWTEVWMGARDGWIPIDTTTGEIGTFGPSHLTLWALGSLDSMTVKVLDCAPKTAPASTAAALPRRANGLTTGYKETYEFIADGKNVGAQTAQIASIQNGAQHWTYTVDLKVPQGAKTIAITQNGAFDITETGEPLSLDTTSTGGIITAFHLAFAKDKVSGTTTVGDVPGARSVALTGPVFLVLGNALTTWSLATRSITLATDKPTALPAFLVDALQTIPLTFTPLRADNITVGDAAIPCHIYTIDPIHSNVWIADASGELLKLTDDRQKLVILRK